jgi:hypothetical protein
LNPNNLKLIEDIDIIIDNIFHTARVQIERTKTNRELNKLEDQYLPKFNKIFTKIVTEYTNYQYLLYEAEKRYGSEVRNLIKSLTTQTYLLGIDYVARASNKPELIYYLTENDYRSIITQSDEAYRMFWRLINKYLQVVMNKKGRLIKTAAAIIIEDNNNNNNATTTDEVRNSSDDSDNTLLDTLTNAKLIINAILTPVLAYSTIQKFRDLSSNEQQQQLILSQNPNITKEDLLKYENASLVFATEKDARVCPTCFQYEGQEWRINSSYIVIPRVHTHPRCRCRLLLRVNGRTISK